LKKNARLIFKRAFLDQTYQALTSTEFPTPSAVADKVGLVTAPSSPSPSWSGPGPSVASEALAICAICGVVLMLEICILFSILVGTHLQATAGV
jgi:hypothetical protein